MKVVGKHIIAEFYECQNIWDYDDEKKLSELLKEATNQANSTFLKTATYKFEPNGITGVALLAESHISIHTWPEDGYAAVDIFTCGDHTKPEKALEYLISKLKPKRVNVINLDRGIIEINYEKEVEKELA